ncbi:MAG: redoxin domain-containing protein, partial [SAR324 cluster bacterium]|nr:redoxin domain-containing protein [SAR324 cluster bacterium]
MEKAEMRLWSSWISGRNRFWKSILVNTTLVVLVVWGVGQWHARNLLPESDAEVVPDFELQSLLGSSHRLHASDGAVFLYFFAPWCTVCRFSISNLNDLPLSSTKNDAK